MFTYVKSPTFDVLTVSLFIKGFMSTQTSKAMTISYIMDKPACQSVKK
jgi:hypothetical protein